VFHLTKPFVFISPAPRFNQADRHLQVFIFYKKLKTQGKKCKLLQALTNYVKNKV
jgi:hypothetical protein